MLAARQRYLKIRKGEIPVGRRHNMLAFDNGQGTQHFWIQRLPGADLVLDHIAAGEFVIHAESCVYRHRLWRIIRMDWMIACKALLLGVAEGLTEFIPVSSSGHLIILGSALNFTGEQAKAFDVVVFFFQAEDGIRDDLVTGVQTCALPI